ncbi:Protein transport protein GOT1 [Lachnellula cervina]|uniref:Protein transport protein GOT1 n=1 Tax=Lachnellula cervina TaxID=1316786 RepID=A0A7D8YQ60_9HELO|nr:Protein transport protein GOT1 [Lachnellula cervina]
MPTIFAKQVLLPTPSQPPDPVPVRKRAILESRCCLRRRPGLAQWHELGASKLTVPLHRNRSSVLLRRRTPVLRPRNILFLIGLTIIIGPSKTLLFFARRQKLKGTAAFFAGLVLILMKWALVGFLVELYGIFILFGDFLGTIAGFARNLPVVGGPIGMLVDRLGVARSGAELPV